MNVGSPQYYVTDRHGLAGWTVVDRYTQRIVMVRCDGLCKADIVGKLAAEGWDVGP